MGTNEERFFGMTREQAIGLADELCLETDENEGSGSYSEYIDTLKRGQEALKAQTDYYPYLPREAE